MAWSLSMYAVLLEHRIVDDTVMAKEWLSDEEVMSRVHNALAPRAPEWPVERCPRMRPSVGMIDVVSAFVLSTPFSFFSQFFTSDGFLF